LARAAQGNPSRVSVLLESRVDGANLFRRGKVRDVYEAGGDKLVIVASDRLSEFDAVLPTPIPDKGRALTQLSNFWFRKTDRIVPNHLISTDLRRFPKACHHSLSPAGRAVLVQHCDRIDIECVARGYTPGAAWTETKA